MFSLWRTGILGGFFGMFTEPLRPKRPDSMTDETVGSFLARRVDRRIADNIVSAVFHGIWAGDVHQLSAKTLLQLAWQLEGRYGSALGGFFRMQSEDERPEQLTLAHPFDLEQSKAMNEQMDLDAEFVDNLKGCSHFTFKDGIQALYRGLQKAVEDKGNVEIRTEAPIQSFTPSEAGVDVVFGVRSLSFQQSRARINPNTDTAQNLNLNPILRPSHLHTKGTQSHTLRHRHDRQPLLPQPHPPPRPRLRLPHPAIRAL
jgi:oxygen-dependent protoporphyrinogen oxidase